jgi:hypothetical protein
MTQQFLNHFRVLAVSVQYGAERKRSPVGHPLENSSKKLTTVNPSRRGTGVLTAVVELILTRATFFVSSPDGEAADK